VNKFAAADFKRLQPTKRPLSS